VDNVIVSEAFVLSDILILDARNVIFIGILNAIALGYKANFFVA